MDEKMYQLLEKICSDRAAYYEYRDPVMASAYGNVLAMLKYAHEGNYECLSQFDYFGEVL